MKKSIINLTLVVFYVMAALSASAAQPPEGMRNEVQQAIANFKKADSTITKFFTNSAGYAVFPNVGKGGLVVGGAHGEGLVFENGTAIGMTTLTQASIGIQAGGQTFAEVIFFETPAALGDFKSGKFEMSADVSAVAAAEGVSKTAAYKNGVAVFTLAKKGLMVQASIGGQKFKFEPLPPEATGRPSPNPTN